MAPSQKKLWRKRIDTQDVDEAVASENASARQRTIASAEPNGSLFFVDKGDLESPDAQLRSGKGNKRQKLTKAQAIIKASQTAKPFPSVTYPKNTSTARQIPRAAAAPAAAPAARSKRSKQIVDLWGNDAVPKSNVRRRVVSSIAPVEVDAPGCSYNPDPEQHQDAVAEAVAAEVRKAIDSQLLPSAPPRSVNYQPEEDELMLLQVEDEGSDEHEASVPGAARTAAEGPGKKTKADRNRQLRRRGVDAALGVKQRLKAQRRDIDQLAQRTAEIAEHAALLAVRQKRKQVSMAEKAASEPPRLGKARFQQEPVQVLLSEEVNGSMRQLKASATLARERFKSLQKRGLIEPREVARQRGKARRK